MSGPIVRKYGFPNFDEIFGKRELQHGAEEPDAKAEPAKPEPAQKPEPKSKGKPKPS